MRRDLPSGPVTFLFTDVEGSTKLLHEIGEEAYARILSEHHSICRAAWEQHSGVEVDTEGDAFFVVFEDATQAVAAAEAAQAALASGPVRVRMGLHTGAVLLGDTGYVGSELHRAARIAASAHGGQVVLSQQTTALVGGAFAFRPLGEHRLKDFPEPIALFQLGDGDFPPLKTISNTNLPRPSSSFVGRARELEEVLARIQGGTRLVTLTGPGGSGKTRLGLEAATTLVPDYMGGVFWVGLASVLDPALVSEAIAQTLGAKDGLAEHIGDKQMLLLLDNLEQVVDAAPGLAALLEACPNLALLCTSRELLRVQGEVGYEVPPLTEPEAISLFCERSGLAPSKDVAELCVGLDHLPLALELAAARTTALTPRQILERLSQRLDLFKGGRDAEARQQTLRATIAWSYDLLSHEDQRLFAALSVFSGGCTLEVAEEVADADLDGLQSLVEKSLLRFTGRYWMLETIREYAAEKLAGASESEQRRRHAEFFKNLAAVAEPALFGSRDQAEWLRRLDAERANFSTAIDWASEADPELALELAACVWRLWWYRGYLLEGLELVRKALETADGSNPRLRMKALEAASYLAYRGGNVSAMPSFCDEGLALARAARDRASEGIFVNQLALVAHASGDKGRADELFQQSARLLEGHPYARYALGNVGASALRRGDTARGLSVLKSVVDLDRAAGDVHHLAGMTAWMAFAADSEGEHRAALDSVIESLTVVAGLGAEEVTAVALVAAAHFLSRIDPVLAACALGSADAGLERIGARRSGVVPGLDEQQLKIELQNLLRGEFTDAYARGRSLPLSAAVECVVASLD